MPWVKNSAPNSKYAYSVQGTEWGYGIRETAWGGLWVTKVLYSGPTVGTLEAYSLSSHGLILLF
jgi:hypothetical protein